MEITKCIDLDVTIYQRIKIEYTLVNIILVGQRCEQLENITINVMVVITAQKPVTQDNGVRNKQLNKEGLVVYYLT